MTTIKIELSGFDATARNLRSASTVIKEELTSAVNESVLIGSNMARDIVGKKTHRLENSLTPLPATWAGGSVSAAWGTNVPYGRVHEEGHKGIEPKNKKALRFEYNGVFIIRRRVKPWTGKKYMKTSREHVESRLPARAEFARDRIIQRIQNGGA